MLKNILWLLLVTNALHANQNKMVILDYSLSMEQFNEGKMKYKLLRQAILNHASMLTSKNPFGVVAFGMWRGCRAQSLLLPQNYSRHTLKTQIWPLRPRGQAAIAKAIDLAISRLPKETYATLVLIADGADNCGVDLCQYGKQLKINFPKISIDVVALAPSQSDDIQLQCLSEQTSGEFKRVTHIAQLAEVIATKVYAVSRVTLTTRDNDENQAKRNNFWKIYSDFNGVKRLVKTAYSPRFMGYLPEGNYQAKVRQGKIMNTFLFSIVAGERFVKSIALSGGTLIIRSLLSSDQQPIESSWSIYHEEIRIAGQANRKTASFSLPKGHYRVVAKAPNLEKQTLTIIINAGHRTSHNVTFQGARIEPVIMDATFIVQHWQVKQIINGKRARNALILTSFAEKPMFIVSEGNYVVSAQGENNDIAIQKISVLAGMNSQPVLTLDKSPH